MQASINNLNQELKKAEDEHKATIKKLNEDLESLNNKQKEGDSKLEILVSFEVGS